MESDPVTHQGSWGHQIDVGGFLRDVVRLASFINAESGLSMVRRGPPTPGAHTKQLARFRSIVGAHLNAEMPRLVISIAATLRAKVDDGSWTLPESVDVVGWLYKGDPPQREALTLREACNKIIHAKKVVPIDLSPDNSRMLANSHISLHGDRSGKPWKAQVSLMDFCVAIAGGCDFDPHGLSGCRN